MRAAPASRSRVAASIRACIETVPGAQTVRPGVVRPVSDFAWRLRLTGRFFPIPVCLTALSRNRAVLVGLIQIAQRSEQWLHDPILKSSGAANGRHILTATVTDARGAQASADLDVKVCNARRHK